MTAPAEAITIYGMMFGTPVDCTLGEIQQKFSERPVEELIAEAGFGVTIGTIFDRAFTSDDPRTLAVAGTVFGPVAFELDRRGKSFPVDDPERLMAFETWKRIMRVGTDYSASVPTHRLLSMREIMQDALHLIGPWGRPEILGSIVQSMKVVEALLEREGESGERFESISGGGRVEDYDQDADQNRAVSLFIAYAHADSKYRDAFVRHLSPLQRQGKISEWYDRKIVPGQDWNQEIDHHLERADLIVPLISADFVSSDYAYGIELKRALEKHAEGRAAVVPVVIKPVHWRGQPFADLQMLPPDAKAVTEWRLQDNAWVTVVKGIERAIASLDQ